MQVVPSNLRLHLLIKASVAVLKVLRVNLNRVATEAEAKKKLTTVFHMGTMGHVVQMSVVMVVVKDAFQIRAVQHDDHYRWL